MSPLNEKNDKWWAKWDNAAKSFDFMNRGVEYRFGEAKHQWFSRSEGMTLLVAVGTGLDLQYFPESHKLIGIDISAKMLEKASDKIKTGELAARLVQADVQRLGFTDNSFDSVVTSCTFCSVPDPVIGLEELRRVLRPGGRLIMFEHVRSDIFWMGPMMDLVSKVSRKFGPEINRRTKENVIKAGFRLKKEVNLYLDMVKIFEA
jgi:ubiquinone/menaquinone biosynthesis C-methylase UbiE